MQIPEKILRHSRKTAALLQFLIRALLLLVGLWGCGVVYYCVFTPGSVAAAAGLAVYFPAVVLSVWFFRKRAVRTFAFLPAAAAIIVYASRQPSNDRIWQPGWEREPDFSLSKSCLTVSQLRDFRYRTLDDYDRIYRTESFDLNGLQSMDLALSHWDGHQRIAHTMLSFNFSDGKTLVVSVETRKPVGAPEGLLAGIYKQYGIIFIFGTVRDLYGVRSDYRKEDLLLYRTNATPKEARQILLDLARRADELGDHPRFYNTLKHNCTTSLLPSIRLVRPSLLDDIRFLFNGLSDQMAYERGWLDGGDTKSFDELKQRARLYAADLVRRQSR